MKLVMLLSNLGSVSVLEWDYFNTFANRNDINEQRWFWIIWFFFLLWKWLLLTMYILLPWRDRTNSALTWHKQKTDISWYGSSIQKHQCKNDIFVPNANIIQSLKLFYLLRGPCLTKEQRETKKYRPLVHILFPIFGKAEKISTFY